MPEDGRESKTHVRSCRAANRQSFKYEYGVAEFRHQLVASASQFDMRMCGTSLKKRCQEGILLVAFDEIDARYQWVSLGVWEVHFQA
jgi:hypothetical protein